MNGEAKLVFVDGCFEIWYVEHEREFVLTIPERKGIPFPSLEEAREELIKCQVRGDGRHRSREVGRIAC